MKTVVFNKKSKQFAVSNNGKLHFNSSADALRYLGYDPNEVEDAML